MREYWISLTRILPDEYSPVFLHGRIRVSENAYSRIFYAVNNKRKTQSKIKTKQKID